MKCSHSRRQATHLRLEALERRDQPSFLAPVTFKAGTDPNAVGVADLNGDGNLDMVSSNINSNNLTVFRGNSHGRFRNFATYSAGKGAAAVVVDDFNIDSFLDVAVLNITDDTVSVYLGNGNLTLKPPATFGAGRDPNYLATGDFNGDNAPDLAISDFFGKMVHIFTGNGDGSFSSSGSYSADYPGRVTAADLNGDGDLDLAVTNVGTGSVGVYLGQGDGTFRNATSYSSGPGTDPWPLVAGDFDGDGDVDLATSNRFGTPKSVTVLLGNGNGSFQTAQQYLLNTGVFAFSLATDDFDSDGDLDLVGVCGYYIPTAVVSVLLGNGDGSFQSGVSTLSKASGHVTTGDFNADGHPDLAVAGGFTTSYVAVMINAADWPAPPIPPPDDLDESFTLIPCSTSRPITLPISPIDTDVANPASIVLPAAPLRPRSAATPSHIGVEGDFDESVVLFFVLSR